MTQKRPKPTKYQPSKPRIFASTFVSEISVGLQIGGVGALMVLLAKDFGMPVNSFAILGSFLGAGMVINAATSQFWMQKLTAGTIFKVASVGMITGALLLAFAPLFWLIILGGALTGLSGALIILLVPITLAGPRAARDIALANGASSTASIAAPMLYGLIASIPGASGRWGALALALPALWVLVKVQHIDFVETPSAYAERWAGRRGRKRRRDLADSFGPAAAVDTFGGEESVKDTQRARATMATPAHVTHIADLSQSVDTTESEAAAAVHEVLETTGTMQQVPARYEELEQQHESAKPASRRAHWILIAAGMLRIAIAAVPEFALSTWGGARLVEIGMTAPNAAALTAAFPLGLAAGRLSANFTIRWKGVFPASVGASILGAIMVGLAPNATVAIAGMSIAGIGTALLYPITVDDMTKIPGLHTRKAAALATIAGGITIFAMPLILQGVASFVSIGHALLIVTPISALLFLVPSPVNKGSGVNA